MKNDNAFFFWLFLILGIMSLCAVFVHAEPLVFDQAEQLSTPTATKMDWQEMCINNNQQLLTVKYQWKTSTDKSIVMGRDVNQVWACRNITVQGTNAECLTDGSPYTCCTGLGTGSCDDDSTCFDDVIKSSVTVGGQARLLGQVLRARVWAKMKPDVLKTPGNDGTFGQ